MDGQRGAERKADQGQLTRQLFRQALDAIGDRVDPFAIAHRQQVAGPGAMARQQDGAHQIALFGEPSGDVAQDEGGIQQAVYQQRGLGEPAVADQGRARRVRQQLERQALFDHRLRGRRVQIGDRRRDPLPRPSHVGRERQARGV